MAESTAALSAEEFQRMQTSLLELRTANYQLADQSSRKDREITNLEQKLRKFEDELQKASRSKRAKASDVLDTTESDALRRKLTTQEEEFRLQQATLIGELQRVIAQQEELEQQVRDLKESGDGDGDRNITVESGKETETGTGTGSDLEKENAKLKTALEETRDKYERQLDELKKSVVAKEAKSTSSNEDNAKKVETLEKELATAKSVASSLEQEKKNLIEKLNNQTEEIQAKSAVLQKEIVELKEQLRRKQGSYVSLSEEKERQLDEFKKSLDNMVQKKDSEIRTVVEELNNLKRQMQTVKDAERLSVAEKASLESALKEADIQVAKVREQNEGFQIQLQETISASDCLSGQLQEARQEVERMQQRLEEANELASKRKNLLDEMSEHLERVKDEFRNREQELVSTREQDVAALTKQLELSQAQSEEIVPLQKKVLLLESLLQASQERSAVLEKQLEEINTSLGSREAQQNEIMAAHKLELEQQLEEVRMESDVMREEYENRVTTLSAECDEHLRLIQELKQEVKDKEDGVKGVERKHQSFIKDLKRQLQSEKKRNDRLQEKLQDNVAATVVAESARNKSPGNTSYEEIRQTELAENRPKTVGDAASVSSWTVVSGNAQKDADRHSTHTGDRDSESSITMLESDNHELISRVTELQKKNFELQERVILLEESSAAMADDLMNKATIIEQFLKEKSAFHIGPSVSPEKLPPGLKKMIDLMKIDQSAVDIRDMNKRLQHMLEETLTKNMHLQKDLEIMSQEVARLSSSL